MIDFSVIFSQAGDKKVKVEIDFAKKIRKFFGGFLQGIKNNKVLNKLKEQGIIIMNLLKKKETKEKNKIRREKIAGYFLNLSQLTFVALVLGGITPFYINEEHVVSWLLLSAGALASFVLASIGFLILK